MLLCISSGRAGREEVKVNLLDDETYGSLE